MPNGLLSNLELRNYQDCVTLSCGTLERLIVIGLKVLIHSLEQ